MTQDCCCKKADRYVSFEGIDCEGNARRIMEHIDRLIAEPGLNNVFWDYFMKKRQGGSGPKPDDLFLIHSNINQIRDLFDTSGDEAAIALLVQIEEECC